MSRSLQAAFVKLFYSSTRFVQLLAPKYFSHLASKKKNFNVSTTLPLSICKPSRASMVIGPRNRNSTAFKYMRLAFTRKTWNRGNNQIKELPPGVFNNNTELTELYVIEFPGSCDDSL